MNTTKTYAHLGHQKTGAIHVTWKDGHGYKRGEVRHSKERTDGQQNSSVGKSVASTEEDVS